MTSCVIVIPNSTHNAPREEKFPSPASGGKSLACRPERRDEKKLTKMAKNIAFYFVIQNKFCNFATEKRIYPPLGNLDPLAIWTI
jgi:hypothetical protein